MSERSSVQNPMLRYVDQIGWHYVSPKDALLLRGGEAGLYFSDILLAQLQKLNPVVADPSRASEILRKLNLSSRVQAAVFAVENELDREC